MLLKCIYIKEKQYFSQNVIFPFKTKLLCKNKTKNIYVLNFIASVYDYMEKLFFLHKKPTLYFIINTTPLYEKQKLKPKKLEKKTLAKII